MLTTSELKQKACAAIESKKQDIIEVAQDVLSHPEAGFSEIKTSRLVERKNPSVE